MGYNFIGCPTHLKNLWKMIYFIMRMPEDASLVGRVVFWYEGEQYIISPFSNGLETPLNRVKIIKKGVKAHIGRFGLADFHWDKIGRFYVGIEISAPYGNFAEVVHPNHHSYTPSGWVKKLEKSIKSFERYCSQWSLGKFDDSYARWRERNAEETAEILAEIEAKTPRCGLYTHDSDMIANQLLFLAEQLDFLRVDIFKKLGHLGYFNAVQKVTELIHELRGEMQGKEKAEEMERKKPKKETLLAIQAQGILARIFLESEGKGKGEIREKIREIAQAVEELISLIQKEK